MLNTSFSNKTQYLSKFFGFFLFYCVGLGPMHLGLGRTSPAHEQWRRSLLFMLQNSKDREMQQNKKKKKEKGKRRLPCAAVMSGWRLQWRRPVVN
jgi:hypothetical protein